MKIFHYLCSNSIRHSDVFLEELIDSESVLRYYPAFNIPNFEIHRDSSNKTPTHCILITYKIFLWLLDISVGNCCLSCVWFWDNRRTISFNSSCAFAF